MDILIREAGPSDVGDLVRFHAKFMEHHVAGDDRFDLRAGTEAQWRERIEAAVGTPEVLVLVAVADAVLVACAYTLIRTGAMDYGPEKVGYLCDVFVEPRSRRNGIARRFLIASQDWLKSMDINRIEASWAIHSEEAQRTWPSLGFDPISVSGTLDF